MSKELFNWIINLSLNILRIKKRNKSIWLFGSWNGETYTDNSKYFFEYVVKNIPEVEAVWITKNKFIKKMLVQDKKTCYMSSEKEGRMLRLNAGYVFFTNGITDIGNYDLSHGAIKIALWHGMPLKKLWYATNNIRKKNNNILRLAQYLYLKTYNPTQRNISIATSEKSKEFIINSFEVKPESVLITGQPRNDVLFKKRIGDNIRIQFEHELNEKFVLYMPTWRSFGEQDSYLEGIIKKLKSDSSFLNRLRVTNTKLYIKPHPSVIVKEESENNIIIIGKSDNIDSQELLAASDLLITDYSSVFIDYALLERPIHFFVPDIEDYKKNGNDLFLSFESFSTLIIQDMNCFKKAIVSDSLMIRKGLENTAKINLIFDSSDIDKGSYCSFLLKLLLEKNIIEITGGSLK